jgi:16S rRNA (uracil1498-N3)-methyltransferase
VTVRRLHAPELPPNGGLVVLGEGSSRHVRVLRLRPGDEVLLFDGSGNAASARIRTTDGAVTCEAGVRFEAEPGPARLVLMLAIPKGAKLEDCVRMATELGVDEIALMRTQRTIPQWDPERARSRLERLTRIAVEAATQCERNDIPIVHGPMSPRQWLQRFPDRARGLLFGARAKGSIQLDRVPPQLWCAVGPEGGFTDGEMTSFEEAGFALASLGKWILRVDTAVAAALTLAQDRLQGILQAR